jgi:hypothetical protein
MELANQLEPIACRHTLMELANQLEPIACRHTLMELAMSEYMPDTS